MAVNIGPKIGIDGEAEYRKELQSIIQQTKTLAAETNAAAAAFKNADDKEKATAEMTEKLNKQIETQKKLIEKLEEGVQKSTEATGENSQETLKWKEQLAKAKTGLANLETQTKDTTGEVVDLGAAEEKTSDQTSVFGDVLKGNLASAAIQKGLQLSIEIVKQLGDFFIDAVKGAAEYADEIKTLNVTTGLGTDTLQEYKYIAELVDVDLNTITGSLTKMKNKMDSARDGNKSAMQAFEDLGIQITDTNGELRSSEDVFNDALAALQKIENPTERDAAAMELFGKSATELNPLIETSAEDLAALKKEAHDVGAVLDKDTLDALNKVQDGMDRMGLSWDALKKELGAKIGVALLPELEKFVKLFQKFVKNGDFSGLIDGIMSSIQNLVKRIKANMPKIAAELGKALGSILGNLPELISAGLQLGYGLLKGLLQSVPEMGKAFAKAVERSRLSETTIEAISNIEELGQMIESIPSKYERMADSLGAVNAKQKEAEHWIAIFDELSKKTAPTAEETAKLQSAVEKLNELYPELGLSIDEETGKWNLNTAQIQANIKALSARYQAEAYYAAAEDSLKQIAQIEAETRALRQNTNALKNAIDNREGVQKVLTEQYLALSKLEYAYSKGAMDIGEYTQALKALGYESRTEANVHMNELQKAISKNSEEIRNMRAEYEAGSETLAEADAKLKQLNGDVEWFFKQGADWESQAYNMAKAIPAGIVKGIKSGASSVNNAAGALMTNAIKRMKDIAQIASPSKVTENVIGKNLALGVIKGWDDVMDPVKMNAAFSLTPAFDAMTSNVTTNNSSTTNLGGVSVNVYASPNQDANAIARQVIAIMTNEYNAKKAVFS